MLERLFVISVLTLTSCSGYGVDERKSYEGYTVIRAKDADTSAIQAIKDSFEVWRISADNTSYLDILVDPQQRGLVTQILNCANSSFNVLIDNFQQAIDQENIESSPGFRFITTCATTTGMSWTKYQSYDVIARYMDCLASQYGHVAQLFNIGLSTEGRALKVLKIGSEGRGQRKPAIWIDGGIHAREWISPAAVSYIMMQLTERINNNKAILDKYDVYIMPSMNPDGYEFSQNSDRMWRKTRSRNGGSSCRGVDPNRNFGYEWGGQGTSSNPCSDIYRGTRPFSEPETAAVRDFILARSRNIKMYLTFHSYGQMILYPWGYDRRDHNDESELYRVGQIGSRAMGNLYTVGSAAKVLYPAAGGSDDWAKGGAGIRYSYTVELPDTGRYGFLLPASRIQEVGGQALKAVLAMADSIN